MAYEADMLLTSKGQCGRTQMEVMFQHWCEAVKRMGDRGVKWQAALGKVSNQNAIAKDGISTQVKVGV